MMHGLDRFKRAQDAEEAGYETALREICAGAKRTHWIWYVFPQLTGLGESSTSKAYAIRDRNEALAYLLDPILRCRLFAMTSAVAEQLRRDHPPLMTMLLGSPVDVRKLVSSLTLFRSLAQSVPAISGSGEYQAFVAIAGEVLATAAREGFPPCRYTLDRLAH